MLLLVDPDRLFVHAICRYGWDDGEEAKGSIFEKYNLWVVDEKGLPLFADSEVRAAGRSVGPIDHPFLPCMGLAWGGQSSFLGKRIPSGIFTATPAGTAGSAAG